MKTTQNKSYQGVIQNSALNNQNDPLISKQRLMNSISPKIQNINQQFPLQRKKSNSVKKELIIKKDENSNINNNNPSQTANMIKQTNRVSNTPNRINSNEPPNNIFRTQKINPPKQSKFLKQTIIKNGKIITNIDLNDDTQSMDEEENNENTSNNESSPINEKNDKEIKNSNQIPQSIKQNLPSQSQQIKSNQYQSSLPNPIISQQQQYSKNQINQNFQKNSINKNIQSQNKLPEKIKINSNTEKLQNQSINSSIKNQNKEQNKNIDPQNANLSSLVQPKMQILHTTQKVDQSPDSVNQTQKQNSSLQNNKVNNESNKISQSKLMRKTSLKASRNKSPPKVIRNEDGKIKKIEEDNNGNSYYITTNEEKIVTDSYICSNLSSYLAKEISSSMIKEPKPESSKRGNGFRLFGQITKAGRNQNGQIKTNQDTPLVHLNVGGIAGFNLFGVLDGHGPHGHFVSQFCRDYFINKMTNYAEYCLQNKINKPEAIYNELKQSKFAFIIDTFKKADIEMSKQKNFDYNFSGTTCNIVFQFNKFLVCASVGDSRSILVEDKGNNKNLGIVPLSTDHKPDLPGEIDRIHLNGGIVDKITDVFGEKVGPPRVWKAEANYPGLAMSRSLGDFQAKQCGVIAIPQILLFTLNKNSKYIVICSDGVWEFISNEQVRDLGNVFFNKNDVGGFCTDLVKFAVHSWEQFDIIRDDITVVCVYF